MLMTKAHVARVARNLHATLTREQLTTLDTIRARDGDAIDPNADDRWNGEEFVDVAAHPRNPAATVVSYKRRIGQTPIMLICSDASVKVMLTSETALADYDVFDEEEGFGLMMDRKLPDLAAALAELSRLGTLAPAEE
jgi:hypothetical protein